MSASNYPALADFLASWFHQDFDIEGETVAEVVGAFMASTPVQGQIEVRRDIAAFLKDHPEDLDPSFEQAFHPQIIASVLSGSTKQFLEEVRDLLPAG